MMYFKFHSQSAWNFVFSKMCVCAKGKPEKGKLLLQAFSWLRCVNTDISSSRIYFYLHFPLWCLCLQPQAVPNSENSKRKIITFIFWYILRNVCKAEQLPECLSTAHNNSINHTASKASTSWCRDGGYRHDPIQSISLLVPEDWQPLLFPLTVLKLLQWSGQRSSFKPFRHLSSVTQEPLRCSNSWTDTIPTTGTQVRTHASEWGVALHTLLYFSSVSLRPDKAKLEDVHTGDISILGKKSKSTYLYL